MKHCLIDGKVANTVYFSSSMCIQEMCTVIADCIIPFLPRAMDTFNIYAFIMSCE